ncbi:hypothetical protein RHS01_04284 [Rhizoctonia solani]|uniref:Uncharacterized protein n=1 Tax=Rhizoctonia solani TaxID=456999 RepID=A0A8H7IDY6_9AGAM|nr:hypothetical protein RHS01_04284 [Rhizoctonia solani]
MFYGTYIIRCVEGNRGLVVPEGAPIMTPIQCSIRQPASQVRVERIKGNIFVISSMNTTHTPGSVVLGAHHDIDRAREAHEVILAPSGAGDSMYTEWEININGADSEGVELYEVRTPSGLGNLFWTSTGEGASVEEAIGLSRPCSDPDKRAYYRTYSAPSSSQCARRIGKISMRQVLQNTHTTSSNVRIPDITLRHIGRRVGTNEAWYFPAMIEDGLYEITSDTVGAGIFIRTGAPKGSPVEIVPGPPPSTIQVKNQGNNRFSFVPTTSFPVPDRPAIGAPPNAEPRWFSWSV